MYRNPDTCLGNTSSMLCAPAGTDVGLFTLHMPLLSLCTTPAILVQSAVPGFPTGLPMGLPASPGGTPVSGYITHHVEGSALFTCVSCQESCHCSHSHHVAALLGTVIVQQRAPCVLACTVLR